MATGVETSGRAWIGALRRSQERLAPMAGALSAEGLLVDSLPLLVTRTGRPVPADEEWTLPLRTTGPERELLLRVSDAVTLEPIGAEARATAAGTPSALTLPAEVLVRLVYGRTG